MKRKNKGMIVAGVILFLWCLLNGWLLLWKNTEAGQGFKRIYDYSMILFGIAVIIWHIVDVIQCRRTKKSKKMRICDFVCFKR